MLLNLGDDVPEAWGEYAQVVEVVSADDEHDKQLARQRWRRYRECGHEPVTHDLGQKTVLDEYASLPSACAHAAPFCSYPHRSGARGSCAPSHAPGSARFGV